MCRHPCTRSAVLTPAATAIRIKRRGASVRCAVTWAQGILGGWWMGQRAPRRRYGCAECAGPRTAMTFRCGEVTSARAPPRVSSQIRGHVPLYTRNGPSQKQHRPCAEQRNRDGYNGRRSKTARAEKMVGACSEMAEAEPVPVPPPGPAAPAPAAMHERATSRWPIVLSNAGPKRHPAPKRHLCRRCCTAALNRQACGTANGARCSIYR